MLSVNLLWVQNAILEIAFFSAGLFPSLGCPHSKEAKGAISFMRGRWSNPARGKGRIFWVMAKGGYDFFGCAQSGQDFFWCTKGRQKNLTIGHHK